MKRKFQMVDKPKYNRKYQQTEDGDRYRFTLPARIVIACCDCSLVHQFVFRRAGKHGVELQVFRDNRATGQLRRYRHVK
jgi:hypothetical protein